MEINFEHLYPEDWPDNRDNDDDKHVIPDWLPVEAEVISRLWLPDSEVLRLKGFHSLSVLNKLQVIEGAFRLRDETM